MTECVLIHADGSRGAVLLKSTPDIYRVPVYTSPSVVFPDATTEPLQVQPLQVPVVTYTKRGYMFDGRPILCAEGLDLKEASLSLEVSAREAVQYPHQIETCLRNDISGFIAKTYDDAIPVDLRIGEVTRETPEQESLTATGRRQFAAREIVAVHV